MSLFVLDTAGNKDLLSKNVLNNSVKISGKTSEIVEKIKPQNIVEQINYLDNENESDDEDIGEGNDYFGLLKADVSHIINDALNNKNTKTSHLEEELQITQERIKEAVSKAGTHAKSQRKRIKYLDHSDLNIVTGKHDDEKLVVINVEEVLQKSTKCLEKLKDISRPNKKQQADLNRKEREKTKGAAWFNLPATEITEEVKNDLEILQMRSVLNPKQFYKKNDLKVLPKYFQIGTVQHSPLDYYNERDTRKNKKRSLVDELLADEAAQSYTKRKYKEIMAKKDKYAHRKAMKKMKKLKKNK